MKKNLIAIALAAAFMPALPAVGATDYSSLEGKSGASLKQAVKEIALKHKEISYGDDTWEAFEKSDVRMIDGRLAWFDMYSNRLVYVASGHSGMNIEHSVANSWWGGVRNAAYKDLHHLNPSDADANNRKNDNPLGVIAGLPSWTNGLTAIGTPAPGYGGGSTRVFEPANEYKGDFARAYFYVFTIYDDITWAGSPACMYDISAYPTLKPWAYEMLLSWAASDPVDVRESERNAAVASIQENENPYVAIPGLAEYVWGSKKNTPFSLADAMAAPVANRPEAPVFSGSGKYDLAGVNTFTGRWWDSFTLALTTPAKDAKIYYAVGDSGEYELYDGGIEIPRAEKDGETLVVKAYAETTLNDAPYRGSTSTLTLTSYDAENAGIDYMNAEWTKVDDAADINEDELYIIVASKKFDVMGWETGASSSSGYLKVAGTVSPEDNVVKRVPENTAIVKLVASGGNQYYVSVNDLKLDNKGFLQTTAAKFLGVAPEGAPAEVGLTPAKNAKIDFGSTLGILYYNASSPRFSCYTSSGMQPVDFYRFTAEGSAPSNVTGISLTESAAVRIFTLEGFEMNMPEEQLPAGLYIVVTPGQPARKMLKR